MPRQATPATESRKMVAGSGTLFDTVTLSRRLVPPVATVAPFAETVVVFTSRRNRFAWLLRAEYSTQVEFVGVDGVGDRIAPKWIRSSVCQYRIIDARIDKCPHACGTVLNLEVTRSRAAAGMIDRKTNQARTGRARLELIIIIHGPVVRAHRLRPTRCRRDYPRRSPQRHAGQRQFLYLSQH